MVMTPFPAASATSGNRSPTGADRSGPTLTFAPAAWRGFVADTSQASGRRVG